MLFDEGSMGSAPVTTPLSTEDERKLTFTDRYSEILHWVQKRRQRLYLVTLPWEDIQQLILIRVSQQYASFDPVKGPFKKWLNKVISNAVRNIWRDNLSSFSRPCITGKGGCPFNAGTDQCTKTPSGRQCGECPAYRDWEKRKKDQHAVRVTLPMDNHVGETHNVQSDFMDVAAAKKVLDAKMRERLTRMEWKAYRLLFIKGLSEEETAKAMGFTKKRGSKSKMFGGYQAILQWKHHFVAVAREIINEEDLA